jgi:hypothetical protein
MNAILVVALAAAGLAAETPAPTLKSILLEQLKSTHNVQDWFVPASKAVDGMTVAQANWKDGKGNHSAAQLINHLTFWNRQQLAQLKGEKPAAFSGKNDETFSEVPDQKAWEASIHDFDAVMMELENLLQAADEAKLKAIASAIAHISAHNAYHTGQILFVRKEQGSWDPEKGVK